MSKRSKLRSQTVVACIGLSLFAAGCDDEDIPAADGGARDTGASTDVAAAGDVAPAAPDAAPLTVQQERGRYLVDNVIACSDCHTPRDMTGAPIMAQYLAGADCFIKLPNGDCLHARNLTNHETGLKNRLDADIKKMFLDGIRPDATGSVALHPVMPYYVFHNMDASDADAIVAYLRTVPGVNKVIPARGPSFNVPAPANYLDQNTFPTPAATYPDRESALRGRYLATKTGLCLECHTPHNMAGPDALVNTKYFQGGEMFPIGLPVTPVSKNLTSDPTTGLGNWTVAEIVRALKEGKDKEGKGICPPMPVGPVAAYGGLTNQDAFDIANYIKSLPAAVNQVVDMCTWPPGMPPAGDGGAPAGDGGVSDATSATDVAVTADAVSTADSATAVDAAAGN